MNATDVRTELGGRFDAPTLVLAPAPTLVLGMPLIVRARVAWAHAARQNAKKKKAGAALDPTHHQRGCDPERRSKSIGPRQGIKTASASRKNRERELDIEIHPSEWRGRQVPAAIDPVARRRRRAITPKRKKPAPPSIQHTIGAGAIPRAGRIRQPLAKG